MVNKIEHKALSLLDDYAKQVINYVNEMGLGLNETSEDYLYYSEYCYSLFNHIHSETTEASNSTTEDEHTNTKLQLEFKHLSSKHAEL